MRSEGFYVNKKSLTVAGIEPASFRFVAQHLNHCATAVPYSHLEGMLINTVKMHIWQNVTGMACGLFALLSANSTHTIPMTYCHTTVHTPYQ